MLNNDSLLPAEFSDLERFASDWAMDSEKSRNIFRVSKPLSELDEFYHAVFPRMDALCDYIDHFSLTAMPSHAARLLQLGLMLMEVVPAVEVYRQPDVPNALAFERFNILSPADPVEVLDD